MFAPLYWKHIIISITDLSSRRLRHLSSQSAVLCSRQGQSRRTSRSGWALSPRCKDDAVLPRCCRGAVPGGSGQRGRKDMGHQGTPNSAGFAPTSRLHPLLGVRFGAWGGRRFARTTPVLSERLGLPFRFCHQIAAPGSLLSGSN